MLLLYSSIKLLAEVALLALLGQWLLGLLAGEKRERNAVYQVFQIVTAPILKGIRLVTPRVVIDRHIPIAAFALLVVVWIAATLGKISHCLSIGVEQCR